MEDDDNKEDEDFLKSLFANPDAKCPECGHEEKFHSIDEGWVSCSADNWSCNCGNNIGR